MPQRAEACRALEAAISELASGMTSPRRITDSELRDLRNWARAHDELCPERELGEQVPMLEPACSAIEELDESNVERIAGLRRLSGPELVRAMEDASLSKYRTRQAEEAACRL